MHSTYGAIEEANVVYIKNGIEKASDKAKEINVLEVGLGTGLNALLSFVYAQKMGIGVKYTAIEPFPLPNSILSNLNYTHVLGKELTEDVFKNIHEIAPGQLIEINEKSTFIKHKIDVRDFVSDELFDLVIFDPFSPDKAPDLWTEDVLKRMHQQLCTNGILTTYCAKGSIKRILKSIGFEVTNPSGPTGKREITTAIKRN
jgi:tRNA U34 5-methylaminomethyl-2-thiouridine-forming methyltransferase MnmC